MGTHVFFLKKPKRIILQKMERKKCLKVKPLEKKCLKVKPLNKKKIKRIILKNQLKKIKICTFLKIPKKQKNKRILQKWKEKVSQGKTLNII